MQKRKIAHIITSLELGGAQKTTLSLLRFIDRDFYDIHIITSGVGPLVEEALSTPGLRVFFIPNLASKTDIFNDIISFIKILMYLKKHDISLVHTHSSKAGIIGRLAARAAGVRFIFHTVHGWPFYIETKKIVKAFYILIEKAASWITVKLIVVSEKDLEAGLRYVNKNKEKYAKIPYGIETIKFSSLDFSGRNKDVCTVGFISCFKPQKAPLDFIKTVKEAVEKNNSIEFISAGDGVLRPEAEKLSQELGVSGKIKFLGWQKDIAGIFSKIDILLLTSRWEGLPVVVLEALASGIPVVATNAGGIPELIASGINGFIEEKGDCQKLANDVLTLAEDDNKRFQFSMQAQKSFREEFDISYMSKRMQSLYKQAEWR